VRTSRYRASRNALANIDFSLDAGDLGVGASGEDIMATIAERPLAPGSEERFFLRAAIAMALLVVAGFSLDLATGRSTFASPPLLHAHAITFMGWVVIYLLQNIFVASGRADLHRRLGWIGAGWIVRWSCWARR